MKQSWYRSSRPSSDLLEPNCGLIAQARLPKSWRSSPNLRRLLLKRFVGFKKRVRNRPRITTFCDEHLKSLLQENTQRLFKPLKNDFRWHSSMKLKTPTCCSGNCSHPHLMRKLMATTFVRSSQWATLSRPFMVFVELTLLPMLSIAPASPCELWRRINVQMNISFMDSMRCSISKPLVPTFNTFKCQRRSVIKVQQLLVPNH